MSWAIRRVLTATQARQRAARRPPTNRTKHAPRIRGHSCGFFPVDRRGTIRYLTQTGRDEATIALVEAYSKAQGMWREPGYEPVYTDTLELDMSTVVPAISGPKRPQDHIALDAAAQAFHAYVKGQREGKDATPKEELRWEGEGGAPEPQHIPGDEGHHRRGFVPTEDSHYQLHDGSIVIASITSCTNTSNPYVMIGAGLVARKARELGLNRKPWVKTSLAPGSQVVSAYLRGLPIAAGRPLNAIGFNTVGYGCTTCIGNSGASTPRNGENDITTTMLIVRVGATRATANFEGPNPHPTCGRTTSGLAASLSSPTRLCGRHERRHHPRAGSREDRYGKPILPQGHLALTQKKGRSPQLVERIPVTREPFQVEIRRRPSRATSKWRGRRDKDSAHLRLGQAYVDLRTEPPYFKDMSRAGGDLECR